MPYRSVDTAQKYQKSLKAGRSLWLMAAAGTLGPVIPPSIMMVVLATTSNLSVGRAFLGGGRRTAFEEVVADTRSYYWLGFAPTWRGVDRRHRLEIEVRERASFAVTMAEPLGPHDHAAASAAHPAARAGAGSTSRGRAAARCCGRHWHCPC